MQPKACVFLAEGFEELEAIGVIDILRRGDITVETISITAERLVTGAHGIQVTADWLFNRADFRDADVLVLPGGMPGTRNLNAYKPLRQLLERHHTQHKFIAAICAAPVILGGLGLLEGKKATCYPNFDHQLTGAEVTASAVEVDDIIITGRGPGMVFDFGLAILKALRRAGNARKVADDMLYVPPKPPKAPKVPKAPKAPKSAQ
jgi:4-methyl-5(b-hydroxyethyl)-thiazole monophosphate biosynthesis